MEYAPLILQPALPELPLSANAGLGKSIERRSYSEQDTVDT